MSSVISLWCKFKKCRFSDSIVLVSLRVRKWKEEQLLPLLPDNHGGHLSLSLPQIWTHYSPGIRWHFLLARACGAANRWVCWVAACMHNAGLLLVDSEGPSLFSQKHFPYDEALSSSTKKIWIHWTYVSFVLRWNNKINLGFSQIINKNFNYQKCSRKL